MRWLTNMYIHNLGGSYVRTNTMDGWLLWGDTICLTIVLGASRSYVLPVINHSGDSPAWRQVRMTLQIVAEQIVCSSCDMYLISFLSRNGPSFVR